MSQYWSKWGKVDWTGRPWFLHLHQHQYDLMHRPIWGFQRPRDWLLGQSLHWPIQTRKEANHYESFRRVNFQEILVGYQLPNIGYHMLVVPTEHVCRAEMRFLPKGVPDYDLWIHAGRESEDDAWSEEQLRRRWDQTLHREAGLGFAALAQPGNLLPYTEFA